MNVPNEEHSRDASKMQTMRVTTTCVRRLRSEADRPRSEARLSVAKPLPIYLNQVTDDSLGFIAGIEDIVVLVVHEDPKEEREKDEDGKEKEDHS